MNLTGSPSLLATFSPALRATTVGFVVVALVFCFLHLSRPDAQMWDESDNAIVIFDTLESENRWVLVRDGEPYFDKPPLWYYLTEVAVDLLGANELALRVVSAVAGFALLLLVFTTAARLFSPIAGLAAGLFMLAVSQLYEVRPGGVFATHHVRSADSDVLMIALAFAAFACFARASTGSRRGLLAGAAFTSLAVLAKGPLGLIPAIAFVAYVALTPARGRVRLRDAALAAGVFGVIFIPWHLGMYLAYGETFLDLYPRYVLYRATDGLAGHTPEPWYYLRVLTNRRIFFGIELVLVALVAVATDRARLARYSHAATLLAFGLTLGILMGVKTKIAWYVLPLYPYAALLVAGLVDRLQRVGAGSSRQVVAKAGRGAVVAIFAVMALAASYNFYRIVRLERGPVQVFFERASRICDDGMIYADEREDPVIRYRLRRYGIERGDPTEAPCFVVRADTPPNAEMATSRVMLDEGGFVLWRRSP